MQVDAIVHISGDKAIVSVSDFLIPLIILYSLSGSFLFCKLSCTLVAERSEIFMLAYLEL
jgi:hypothetical protein